MRRNALDMNACRICGHALQLASVTAGTRATVEIVDGSLEWCTCHATVPIVRNLPRFVPSDCYADSFGCQWNRFDTIQIAAVMQSDLDRDRWNKTTGWPAPIGVLQRRPDVAAAFRSPLPFLRPDGEIVVDVCELQTGFSVAELYREVDPFLARHQTPP